MSLRAKPHISLPLFAAATLAPLVLCLAGAVLQGGWAFVALVAMTLAVPFLDALTPPEIAEPASEENTSPLLLVLIALGQIALMVATLRALTGGMSLPEGIALGLATGLWLGQVGNPAAHELIHRGDRWLFILGVVMFSAILFGHHASSHRLVHHVAVATPADPNTARRGEGFYHFFLRAWGGSFHAGWRAETALRGRRHGGWRPHPYLGYGLVAMLALGMAKAIGGWAGVALWLALTLHAQVQLLLSDYVQHYGLERARRGDGTSEPVGPQHSWNARHWFSGAMMLNAPRHSDHHLHPARNFAALRLPDGAAPMLPWPLPVACTLALMPPIWHRRIAPHLDRWRS